MGPLDLRRLRLSGAFVSPTSPPSWGAGNGGGGDAKTGVRVASGQRGPGDPAARPPTAKRRSRRFVASVDLRSGGPTSDKLPYSGYEALVLGRGSDEPGDIFALCASLFHAVTASTRSARSSLAGLHAALELLASARPKLASPGSITRWVRPSGQGRLSLYVMRPSSAHARRSSANARRAPARRDRARRSRHPRAARSPRTMHAASRRRVPARLHSSVIASTLALVGRQHLEPQTLVALDEHAVGHDEMVVDVEVHQSTEAPLPRADRADDQSTDPARPRWFAPEHEAQRLGHREHPLPEGCAWQHAIHEMRSGVCHSSRGAARTDSAPLAAERHHDLVVAGPDSARARTRARGCRT